MLKTLQSNIYRGRGEWGGTIAGTERARARVSDVGCRPPGPAPRRPRQRVLYADT